MMIINFDDIIGKKFNTITNNIFCLSHPIFLVRLDLEKATY